MSTSIWGCSYNNYSPNFVLNSTDSIFSKFTLLFENFNELFKFLILFNYSTLASNTIPATLFIAKYIE